MFRRQQNAVLQPFKTNHGEENSSRIQCKACWLLNYLQLSGARKDYGIFLLFVKGRLLTVWNSGVLKMKKISNSLILELLLLKSDTHFWYAQFEFSQTFSLCLAACLTCAKTAKKSSTVCFYSASHHWKVCDGFTFNLPWLWYYIYHSIE